jgi:class 3 adenylate cyclase/streptogramin lyase
MSTQRSTTAPARPFDARAAHAPMVPPLPSPGLGGTITDVGELPHGTVTLLFTDVEGSTQLQHRLGERYQEVVGEHRRLLEEAFAEHGGVVVDRQTESFFVAFSRARRAVSAAAAAQLALAGRPWPDGVQVRVRMGIHSGDPEVVGDRYVGLAVSRAARICASAHGGQVLLSSSARALLSDHERTALRNLGFHQLKDFAEAELISQLVVDGLPSQFPPLRSGAAPSRTRRLLLAAAAVVLAGVIGAAVVALRSGGSGAVEVGPTSLAVIDPASNRVVHAIDLGFTSSLIAAGEGHIWVVDPRGSTLRKVDPRTRTVEVLPLGVGAGDVPFGVAVGRGSVWVAVLRGTRQVLLELGPEIGELRDEIQYGDEAPAPVLFRLHPVAVGAGAGWAIDASVGGLWRIHPRTEGKRRLVEGLDALSLAVGTAVWVAGGSNVTKIDAATGLPLGSALIVSGPPAETSAVTLGGDAVWFVASSSSRLFELDPESVATRQTFSVGAGAAGVAVGEAGVWVANSRDGTVTRVDPHERGTRTIEVGPAPGGVVAAYGAVWVSPGEPRS